MPEESKLAKKYEEATKFTKDEMNELKKIQTSYMEVQNNLGQLAVAKLRLERQIEVLSNSEIQLKTKFNEVQEKEQKFVDGVTEKYGDGTLDPESGTFISNK
jgi:predicted nuclease with TOPRIM domain